MGLSAIVIGSTGLVGRHLVDQLLVSDVERVVSLVRRPSGRTDPKLAEHVVDFRAPEQLAPFVQGDVLFSALGTTIKVAGTQAAQYEVDYTYQFRTAQLAAKAGVTSYALVSSASASPSSLIFYSRMKGELERDVATLGFSSVTLARPGLLLGTREQPRLGEQIGEKVMGLVGWLPGLRNVAGIEGSAVAKGLIAQARRRVPGITVITNKELLALAAG